MFLDLERKLTLQSIGFFGYDSKRITKTIQSVVIFFNFFHILNKRRRTKQMILCDFFLIITQLRIVVLIITLSYTSNNKYINNENKINTKKIKRTNNQNMSQKKN